MVKRLRRWFKEGPSILLEDNKRLRQHNDALRNENDELRGENSRLHARNDALTSEVNSAGDRYKSLEHENLMLKAQLHDRDKREHELWVAANPPIVESDPDVRKFREEMIEKTVKEYARVKGTNLKKGELQRIRESLERMGSLVQIATYYELYRSKGGDNAK